MSGRDWFRLVSTGFDRFRVPVFTGFYWFRLVSTGFYCFRLVSTGFDW